MNRIKKGDEIIVIAGKDKGARGKVLKVIMDKMLNKVSEVVVEGVNLVTKHVKPNPQRNQQGGIVKQEKPIDASNVMLYNPAIGRGDRIGYKVLEDGRKVRYFKSNNEVVDV